MPRVSTVLLNSRTSYFEASAFAMMTGKQHSREENAPSSRWSILPPEILAEILVIDVHTKFNAQKGGVSRRYALRLSWISNYWRSVALNTPELWTCRSLLDNWPKELHERSGTWPLTRKAYLESNSDAGVLSHSIEQATPFIKHLYFFASESPNFIDAAPIIAGIIHCTSALNRNSFPVLENFEISGVPGYTLFNANNDEKYYHLMAYQ
ncbi:hypothetical protein ABKN59_004821 [Abortiporus biennis]